MRLAIKNPKLFSNAPYYFKSANICQFELNSDKVYFSTFYSLYIFNINRNLIKRIYHSDCFFKFKIDHANNLVLLDLKLKKIEKFYLNKFLLLNIRTNFSAKSDPYKKPNIFLKLS